MSLNVMKILDKNFVSIISITHHNSYKKINLMAHHGWGGETI